MLRQGAIPPEQVGKYQERKRHVDQILTKEVEEMKRIIEVSVWTEKHILQNISYTEQDFKVTLAP